MSKQSGKGRSRAATRAQTLDLKIDVPLLLVTCTLLIFGLLMVYSASWDFSLVVLERSPTHMFVRQVIWLFIGLVAAVAATLIDYHYWRRFALPAMLVTIFLLVAVLVVNEVRLNAARSLSQGSVMPSELAKFVTIVYLAVWLYSKRNTLRDVRFGLVPLAVIIGLVSGLILFQPDLSASATIVFLGVILFFLAGGELRQIALFVLVVVLIGWLFVQIMPTGRERVGSYMQGLTDLTQASYHVQRSAESFVKGGWFGVGIGKADTKLTGLPVPPTDSIFAVVGEETGVLGSALLVGLYAYLTWRGILIARNAPDMLGSLLAAGMSLWLAMEAFINMAVMVSLLPFAGNALPFISAGGSSLVVSLVAVGTIMNVARASRTQRFKKGNTVHAAVSVRRGQRGGRVPRPGSDPSAG